MPKRPVSKIPKQAEWAEKIALLRAAKVWRKAFRKDSRSQREIMDPTGHHQTTFSILMSGRLDYTMGLAAQIAYAMGYYLDIRLTPFTTDNEEVIGVENVDEEGEAVTEK